MPPAHDPRGQRSGEWSVMRESIDQAVREAMRKALDEESGVIKGAECGEKSRDDMRRLVGELQSSFISCVGNMRQDLLDRLNETSSDLKIMVREEVGPLRVQCGTMEITLKDLQEALHQGDTRFAVIGTKMDTMQGEINRVRDTPANGRKATKERGDTTDKHQRPSGDDSPLTRNPLMTIILTAVITAAGTTMGTWGMDLLGRGAKVAVQDAVKDGRPAGKDHSPPTAPNGSHDATSGKTTTP